MQDLQSRTPGLGDNALQLSGAHRPEDLQCQTRASSRPTRSRDLIEPTCCQILLRCSKTQWGPRVDTKMLEYGYWWVWPAKTTSRSYCAWTNFTVKTRTVLCSKGSAGAKQQVNQQRQPKEQQHSLRFGQSRHTTYL